MKWRGVNAFGIPREWNTISYPERLGLVQDAESSLSYHQLLLPVFSLMGNMLNSLPGDLDVVTKVPTPSHLLVQATVPSF